MPPSSLAEYLAKNYLTADPAPTSAAAAERPKKKRKKKHDTDGLIIADDDPPDLRSSTTLADRIHIHGDVDDDSPYVVTGAGTGEFRRAKKSGWKRIGGDNATATTTTTRDRVREQQQEEEAAAADAILASAAAENAARKREEEEEAEEEADDAPLITDNDARGGENADGAMPRMMMESGARAGLQTAAQTAAMVAAQEKRRKADAERYVTRQHDQQQQQQQQQQQHETIYRDASGRIINVAMKRAEARKAEQEKKDKEERAREALMGDVQRREKEARRQELREARAMPLARTIEDEELNEELKARQRWDDPAAQFLTTTTTTTQVGSMSGRPMYKGGFQPNRYWIRPGHRWDGVDRGNGFEKEWFAARNRKGRLEALEYQWQYDE